MPEYMERYTYVHTWMRISFIIKVNYALPPHLSIKYLQNRKRLIDVENKLMVTKGERERGINWEIGTDIYTLLYMK